MAQTITRSISVDVAQENRMQPIVAKQYDRASRFLKVQFLNLGNEIIIDPNAIITINAKRSDGQGLSFSGSVLEDGTVRVPLTYWMLELDGPVECDISVITGENNDTMLTSTSFTLEVQVAAVSNTDAEENEDYPVLLQLIGEVQECKEDVQEITTAYEQSAENIKETYEASMAAAVADLEEVISAAQVVIGPFFIADITNTKNYTAAIQIKDGKPRRIYEEYTTPTT